MKRPPTTSIRVIVLTGAGDVFSLGADHSDDAFDPFVYYDRSQRFLRCFLDLDKPVVVAMNGNARGLGWTIALTGDVTIAERQVVLRGHARQRRSVVGDRPFLWPLSSGLLRAKRYLLPATSSTPRPPLDMGSSPRWSTPARRSPGRRGPRRTSPALRPETLGATKRVLNQWLRLGLTQVYDQGLALEFMTFPKAYADSTRGGGNGRDSSPSGGRHCRWTSNAATRTTSEEPTSADEDEAHADQQGGTRRRCRRRRHP